MYFQWEEGTHQINLLPLMTIQKLVLLYMHMNSQQLSLLKTEIVYNAEVMFFPQFDKHYNNIFPHVM